MMKSQSRSDNSDLVTTFVNEREAVKLTEMLTLAAADLERVSGGVTAALGKSTACCCCHHLA
jgi:hypothetical protein